MIAAITEQRMREIAAQLVNTYVNVDGAYGGQCWDSATFINEHFFGLPRINTGDTAEKSGRWPGWAGNMVDCFPQTAEIEAAYELVSPDHRIIPGDTLVWDDSNSMWFPATHVATAVATEARGWVLTLSQNSSAPRPDLPGYSPAASGPVILQTLPKQGLLGIIRPRTGGIQLTPASAIINQLEDAGMALSIEDLQAIQGFVQTERATVVSEVRANATATVNAVTEALDKAVWAIKTFDQSTDNENADRIILDFRSQLQAIRDEFSKEV